MANIIKIIKSLGKTAEIMVGENLIPSDRFEYLFEGAETFTCESETGLTLVFDDISRQLKSVQLCLINNAENSEVYSGYMPEPFLNKMSKEDVRSLLGEPDSSSGAKKIPGIGVVGGNDIYIYKLNDIYPGTRVRLLYSSDSLVRSLIFEPA